METRERQAGRQPVMPSRPPKTWRERIFHSLPCYTGPYSVGYLEIELPVDNPQTFSRIRRHNQHALQLDTVLFSLYYPSNADPKKKKTSASRVPWLPRPRVPTCHGYAEFFNIPNLPVTAYMAATCMWTKLPAFRNARLAHKRPSSSGMGMTDEEGKEEEEEEEEDAHDRKGDEEADLHGAKPTFPVIVFTHGLGGSRTMYSTVCGDLASYGFVVVAMEHRDGSGARTFVNVPPGKHSPELSQEEENGSGSEWELDKSTTVTGTKPKRTRNYTVDYIFPKDNAQDTAPHNAKGVDRELRGAQIEMRLAEIEEAFKALRIINAGDPDNEIRNTNLRKKPNRGSSSKGLDGIDWADWKGRLSLENVTAMGHSFGGATTVQILRLNHRFPWIGQGILLDVWGPATPEVSPGSEQSVITKPLLSIGSEAFMHWKDNHDRVTEICTEAEQAGAVCWMLTVRGSTHLSQTDFAVLYPRWMSLFLKTIVNPLRGIYLTIAPTLEFLKVVLPPAQKTTPTTMYDTSGWVDNGLLWCRNRPDSQVLLEHKPDEKWTAARLKIDNEFRLRFRMWWNTTVWKGRGKGGGGVAEGIPKDERGRPLFGLKTWGPGEEIWVHMCPSDDIIRRRGGEASRDVSDGRT